MVLYFSGTGNSRCIAEKIAQISGDELLCVGERIKAHDESAITSERPFVIVGPVYAGRLPRIVDEYLRRIELRGTNKVYFAVSCAATPWKTVRYAKKLCREKGLELLGFNSVVMPQGYVAAGTTQSDEVNDRILKVSEGKITAIAEKIRDGMPLDDEKSGLGIMSSVINPVMYSTMITAKPFYTTDACSSCGKCAQRCPLNNITLTDGRPIWGNECTHCMACIAGCPTEAVEYGKKTHGKTRYYLGEK